MMRNVLKTLSLAVPLSSDRPDMSKRKLALLHLIASLGLLLAIESVADSKNGFVLDDALVPLEQILHGGPGRDGIPSLDDPTFVAAGNNDKHIQISIRDNRAQRHRQLRNREREGSRHPRQDLGLVGEIIAGGTHIAIPRAHCRPSLLSGDRHG